MERKVLGFIGGLSPESTSIYPETAIQVAKYVDKSPSIEMIIIYVDWDKINQAMKDDDWDTVYEIISTAAFKLKSIGANMLVLCTNTLHKLIDRLQADVGLPFVHIADAVASTVQTVYSSLPQRVLLLGTKTTLKERFYVNKLKERGIEAVIPNEGDIDWLHNTIIEELCKGIFKSDKEVCNLISRLRFEKNCIIVALCCTELEKLPKVTEQFRNVIIKSAEVHARYATLEALGCNI